MDLPSLDEYYRLLEPFSVKSIDLELDDEEINALLMEGKNVVKDGSYSSWNQNETLISLGQKIDHQISVVLKSDSGFLHLNNNTLKDGVFSELPRIKKLYDEELCKSEDSRHLFRSDFNWKMVSVFRSLNNGMKIKYGLEDGVRLLVHSCHGLSELQNFKEGVSSSRPKLSIREFLDLQIENEFKVFIFKKKMCCISQFNPNIYFPGLVEKKNEIEGIIRKFIETNVFSNEKFSMLQSVIIDIVLIGDNVRITQKRPTSFPVYSSTFVSPNSTQLDQRTYFVDHNEGTGLVVIQRVGYEISLYRPNSLPMGEGFYVVSTPHRRYCSLTRAFLGEIDILAEINKLVYSYNGTKLFQGKNVDMFELKDVEMLTWYYSDVNGGVPVALQKGKEFFDFFHDFSTDFDHSVLEPPHECFDEQKDVM